MNSTSTLSLRDGERDVGRDGSAQPQADVPTEGERRPISTGGGRIVRRTIRQLVTALALATYLAGVSVLLRELGSRCLSWLPSLYRSLGYR